MNFIKSKYKSLCRKRSDINEHLPTLYNYATKCESVLELGVRGVVSSFALTYGLLNNNKSKRKILLNDVRECNVSELLNHRKDLNIEVSYEWKNDLHLEIKENYDLTFIDTWHVYGQLRRELDKFSKVTNKYIIMHDTTVDEWKGETIRQKLNAKKQAEESGFPMEEIMKGLWPAIEEFLEKNKNWKIKERYRNNNGLTVLEKIN